VRAQRVDARDLHARGGASACVAGHDDADVVLGDAKIDEAAIRL
jgi:hypothetical protein